MTVNESQMEILEERGQDFLWRVEQRNKTYLIFDVGENVEYVQTGPTSYANFCCIKAGSETNTRETNTREQAINWREERKNGPDE